MNNEEQRLLSEIWLLEAQRAAANEQAVALAKLALQCAERCQMLLGQIVNLRGDTGLEATATPKPAAEC